LAETAEVQCANPACKIRQDGKCVEGLPFEKCPDFGKPLVVQPSVSSVHADGHGIVLALGDLLNSEEASQVLRRGESRVIAVVAPKEAGKTTLISSVLELFQRGPVGSFRFCGSRTLYAFERACFPSRGVSRNEIPKTERTLLTEAKFYHTVLRKPGEPLLDLLIADRNGEDYGSAPDETSVVQGFLEIRRADTITFIVDGRQLVNPVTRNSVGSDVLAIVQALVDGGAIEGRPRAALVLTKLDEVARSADPQRVKRDFDRFEAKFREHYERNFGQIKSFKVAACPSDTSLPVGHGVPELLAYWEEASPLVLQKLEPHDPPLTRSMHRLQGSRE
jgi:Double-GTPase 2